MKVRRPASSRRRKSQPPRKPPRRKGKVTEKGEGRDEARFHVISARRLRQLEGKLHEARQTLDAIRSGEVDAVVVNGSNGNKIYSITGAEQPYRIYVERMQEGAVTVSAEGVILYCNQRFARMVRQKLERVIGADLPLFLPEMTWEEIATVFDHRRSATVVKREDTLLLGRGITLPVNITASRLPLEGQEIACLVITDLTAQRQQESMRLAKEVAERASEAKDAFLAALSHELRTPLNPALLMAIAQEQNESLPPDTRHALSVIRRNVELQARMIDDLLDLTRVTHGKLNLHMSPLDVHAILALAVDICRPDIDAKEQRLELALGATRTRGNGDAVRLQQALWNVIRNASKFTPPRGKITVTTADQPDGRISIEVRDTGIGFPTGEGESLFRPFVQGGNHITQRFGGLGLGLTISRSILLSHGGSIAATSDGPGRGATFILQFPGEAVAEVPASPVPPPPIPPVVAPRGVRILLVEDHNDTRRSMELLLRETPYRVSAAATASEALALAAEEEFDLVITDIGLPDKSGLELMRELRDLHGLRGIATTGYGMREDVENAKQAGFRYHLTKPIDFDQLQHLILELLASPDEREAPDGDLEHPVER